MPAGYFWRRTSENNPSETVWKTKMGSTPRSHESEKRGEKHLIDALHRQKYAIQPYAAIFQTVSPRTPVNKGS